LKVNYAGLAYRVIVEKERKKEVKGEIL
jgi:hypothetical protein